MDALGMRVHLPIPRVDVSVEVGPVTLVYRAHTTPHKHTRNLQNSVFFPVATIRFKIHKHITVD